MTEPLSFHWYLPTYTDSHQLIDLGTRERARIASRAPREVGLDYMRQIAGVAEETGFDGVMLPTAVAARDGGLLAAALAGDTRRLQLMVVFRAGLELPTHFAQRIATLQRLSGQRIQVCLFNGSAPELRASGDFIGHDAAYERADEFLQIARKLWRGEAVQHASPHYVIDCSRADTQAEASGIPPRAFSNLPAATAATPRIHVFGASEAAARVVARHADVHQMWGEPPDMIQERITHTRQLARSAGRTIHLGLRTHIIARQTEAEAWAEAERLLQAIPARVIDEAQQQLARSDSVGIQRTRQLHQAGKIRGLRELEIHPNLWAGPGLVRGGTATALVGSYAQVANRITEYVQLGFSHFVFSGFAQLENLRRTGEEILPRVATLNASR